VNSDGGLGSRRGIPSKLLGNLECKRVQYPATWASGTGVLRESRPCCPLLAIHAKDATTSERHPTAGRTIKTTRR
jgi:hypothetical protein